MNLPFSLLGPLPSVLSLGIIEKKVWFHALCIFSSGIFASELDILELSILWVNSPICLSISSYERCSAPFVEVHCTSMLMSLFLRRWQLDPSLQVWPQQDLAEKKVHLPQAAGWISGCMPSDASQNTVFATGKHWWHIFEFPSIRNSTAFTKLLSKSCFFFLSGWLPLQMLVLGFAPPQLQDLAFVYLVDDLTKEHRPVVLTTAYKLRLKWTKKNSFFFFKFSAHGN